MDVNIGLSFQLAGIGEISKSVSKSVGADAEAVTASLELDTESPPLVATAYFRGTVGIESPNMPATVTTPHTRLLKAAINDFAALVGFRDNKRAFESLMLARHLPPPPPPCFKTFPLTCPVLASACGLRHCQQHCAPPHGYPRLRRWSLSRG